MDATSDKLDAQGNKIDSNNQKTEKGIGLERDRTAEAGKDVDKQVNVDDYGTVDALNRRSEEPKTKKVTLDDYGTANIIDRAAEAKKNKPINFVEYGNSLSNLNKRAASPVRKVINFITGRQPEYAQGTPRAGHPGGLAIVGDGGGRELISLPNGRHFLSPNRDTMLPLPKGTHVLDHKRTASILNGIPKYAKGTYANASDVLALT